MRQEHRLTIEFPVKGLSEDQSLRNQPPGTSKFAKNVRAYEPIGVRSRGGTRPGVVRYIDATADGAARIQDIVKTTVVSTGAASQTSVSVRTVRALCTSNGKTFRFDGGSFSEVTNSKTLASGAPVIFSTEHLGGDVYYADGTNAYFYDSSANQMDTWTASAGSLPTSGANKPRLIETWRGRIVQSGIKTDPHNWFMSAVGDATDWDYAPTPEVVTQAVAGNNSPAGKVGDAINCMIPYNDDILIFGCDHTIWRMSGDPMEGGRLDMVTNITGIAWGRPYCIDSTGVIYFFGSRGGVYRMTPGSKPERLTSLRIENRLRNIDLSKNIVRMIWNDRDIGVNVFISNVEQDSTPSDHFFWDARNDAWWMDSYADPNYDPVAVLSYDGDSADDRVMLIGSEDGYIRYLSSNSRKDDQMDITSEVWFGPYYLQEGEIPFILKEIQGIVVETSDDISLAVFGLDTPEDLLLDGAEIITEDGFGAIATEAGVHLITESGGGLATPMFTATLQPKRTPAFHPRARGFYCYFKLSSTSGAWAIENMHLKLDAITSSRGRRI